MDLDPVGPSEPLPWELAPPPWATLGQTGHLTATPQGSGQYQHQQRSSPSAGGPQDESYLTRLSWDPGQCGVSAVSCVLRTLHTPLSESLPAWSPRRPPPSPNAPPLCTPGPRPSFRTQISRGSRPHSSQDVLLWLCAWESGPSSLPLPWGPGSLPHCQPLLLLPSEALQNILTHPLTQVDSISVPTSFSPTGLRPQLSRLAVC